MYDNPCLFAYSVMILWSHNFMLHDVTWPHMISHGLSHHMVSHGLTWYHMTSHGRSHDVMWCHMISHMMSHDHTWSHMVSYDLAWSRNGVGCTSVHYATEVWLTWPKSGNRWTRTEKSGKCHSTSGTSSSRYNINTSSINLLQRVTSENTSSLNIIGTILSPALVS